MSKKLISGVKLSFFGETTKAFVLAETLRDHHPDHDQDVERSHREVDP